MACFMARRYRGQMKAAKRIEQLWVQIQNGGATTKLKNGSNANYRLTREHGVVTVRWVPRARRRNLNVVFAVLTYGRDELALLD